MNEQNLLDFSFIILSAGFGKRMKSDIPKGAVLLKNKPIILHIIDTLYELGINDIITVVGYKKEIIMGILKNKVKIDELQNVYQAALDRYNNTNK